MQFAHGRIWKQNLLVEINHISINLQAIDPPEDLDDSNVDLAADAAVVVETATFVDAEEVHQPIQSLQSERPRAEDAEEAAANPSEDKVEEEPDTGDAPPARRDEGARREETRRSAGVNKAAVGAPEEEDLRMRPATAGAKEAPAPETADPARLTLKSRLWIQEANARRPSRRHVNLG